MALRALMLKKRLDDKRKELEDLKNVDFWLVYAENSTFLACALNAFFIVM